MDMLGLLHSSPTPAIQAAAAEPGFGSEGNLLDTVSNSVAPGLKKQTYHQPEPAQASQNLEEGSETVVQLVQRQNAADARADQADSRFVDMTKEVEGTHQALASLLAQVQEASRATASLAEVGQAEATRVAASVIRTTAADRAADTDRRTPCSINWTSIVAQTLPFLNSDWH